MASRFIKNSGTLLTGNIIAQGIAFLAYTLLLRLFTPEDFGLCNVFFSYTEVLIILSTCKYEMAQVVAENHAEAMALKRLSLRINAWISLALMAVAVVLAATHANISNLPPHLLLLIPILVYFTGTNRVYIFLCNRHRQYKQIATGEVVSVVGGTATRILFGLLAPLCQLLHTTGLPLGSVLGKVAGHLYLHHAAPKTPHNGHTQISTPALAKKYKNFPLYVMPKELVSSFSANLPLMWLSVYFEKPLLGLFSLALTFTQRPVGVLANTFEKVFYESSAAKVATRQPLWKDVRRFTLLLGAATVVVCTAVFFLAEPLFVFLFGNQWVGTGYYVRCLLPWMGILVVTNSLAFVANIFGTQRVDFGLQVAQLLLRIAALYIGIVHNNFPLAILLFAAVSAAVQALQLGWYLLQVHRYDTKNRLT